jgi:hypothetical protein
MMKRRSLLKAIPASLLAAALVPLAARAQPATRILFVHGRAQEGRDPDAIKAEWLGALQLGAQAIGRTLPQNLSVALPYYGDTLDKFARAAEIPLASEMKARGTAQDDEFLVFQAEIAEEIRKRAGITEAQVDAEYGANTRPRGPLNWEWVQAILRAIDKNGPGMNQKTLELFTRDVFLYSTRAGVRDEVDAIVAAALTEEPTVVVGHSLGSVVAYSVLRTDRRNLKIPLFLTIGSPLAVRGVRDQFKPLRPVRRVDNWFNAFDVRDVVALYPLDADNFPVQPPVIENRNAVRNQTDNRHGIVGYLNDPEVARRILGAMSS